MTEITRDAIIAAYQRTEIVPVARTWDTRATLPDGREVACGCALVVLCRAAGIDPEPIMSYGLPSEHFARALGLTHSIAGAVLRGWDRWPAAPESDPLFALYLPASRAAYLAAWEAAAVVLGGRRTSRADAELPADPHEAQGDADANA